MPPGKKVEADKRKSGGKPTLLVTLNVDGSKLKDILVPRLVKEETPMARERKEVKESPPASANGATNNANGDTASDSNTATPAADGTNTPGSMAPPNGDNPKKGSKRAAPENGIDSGPKAKGRPGPKKKPRLEDGTIDHSTAKPAAHKLGPKANQGAINAGLRALDRSGKPCRKWEKGGFKLKSFTGTVWEIHRWSAPPKKPLESGGEESASASAADNSSGKENKALPAEGNSGDNSNAGADVEMNSSPSVNTGSPAPLAVATAS